MNGGVKPMKMLGSLRKKLKDGMTSEYLRDNFMLVRKFYCIGLVSDFLQESYCQNGKDLSLLKKYTVQEQ